LSSHVRIDRCLPFCAPIDISVFTVQSIFPIRICLTLVLPLIFLCAPRPPCSRSFRRFCRMLFYFPLPHDYHFVAYCIDNCPLLAARVNPLFITSIRGATIYLCLLSLFCNLPLPHPSLLNLSDRNVSTPRVDNGYLVVRTLRLSPHFFFFWTVLFHCSIHRVRVPSDLFLLTPWPVVVAYLTADFVKACTTSLILSRCIVEVLSTLLLCAPKFFLPHCCLPLFSRLYHVPPRNNTTCIFLQRAVWAFLCCPLYAFPPLLLRSCRYIDNAPHSLSSCFLLPFLSSQKQFIIRLFLYHETAGNPPPSFSLQSPPFIRILPVAGICIRICPRFPFLFCNVFFTCVLIRLIHP